MVAKWLLVGIGCALALGVVGDVVGPGEADVGLENSIYRSVEARDRLMAIYDERLADWPVPFEELDVETSYGTAHAIASGPEDGEPVLLLHASELSATSWGPNIEAFAGYRTYAIDHIGEVNKSRLADVDVYPKTRAEIAGLYAEIADNLGIERSIVVGASNGGFVAMTYAIRYPERVSKLILPGPMGLTPPPLQMGLRLVAAQFIHWTWVERGALEWILGTSPVVLEPYGGWFTWVMRGSFPRVVPPVGIPAAELATIEAPVLLFLGTKDNLVGDPQKAAAAASAMGNVRTVVVESAHLVNVEVSDEVNREIAQFLSE
jgi:pimeloyl-ACP methyl ester carboxylesterase